MKILGITAEYNPFHNGHKYHIEKSRELTGADCVVAVMSGSFTQRGEPAILDKWERSRLAVENGVNLVVELPFVYACNGAEAFAKGAVDILAGLGADVISFGSESGDISSLQKTAGELLHEADNIAGKRAQLMRSGMSFAKATEIAAEELLGKSAAGVMLEPNNILALEYLKRISFLNENGHAVEAVTVARHGSGYFAVNEAAGFAGASAIRRMTNREEFGKYVPAGVAEALENIAAECALHAEAQMFRLIRSEIVKNAPQELAEIYRMGEGLENRLKKEIIHAADMKSLISGVVSKRYTEAAVRRLLVYVLLGIRKYELPQGVYGRVLAADDTGRKLLSDLRKRDVHIPLITNVNKDAKNNEAVQECMYYDMLAADMYNLIYDRDLYAFSDKVRKPYMADLKQGCIQDKNG